MQQVEVFVYQIHLVVFKTIKADEFGAKNLIVVQCFSALLKYLYGQVEVLRLVKLRGNTADFALVGRQVF